MTDRQSTDPCPQCRTTDAVHSISELTAMAKSRLSPPPAGGPAAAGPGSPAPEQAQPGSGAGPQPGYSAEPQPSWGAEPQPGYSAEPVAGGHTSGSRPGVRRPGLGDILDPGRYARRVSEGVADDIEGAIAGAALGAAAKFISRRVGRRVQQAYTERVVPTMAAQQEAVLQQQAAIAERHPDLRACLTDNVIFLAGGDRVMPLPRLDTLTAEQADALVTQLRGY